MATRYMLYRDLGVKTDNMCTCEIYPNSSGDYVLYDDYQAEVNRMNEDIKRLIRDNEFLQKLIGAK